MLLRPCLGGTVELGNAFCGGEGRTGNKDKAYILSTGAPDDLTYYDGEKRGVERQDWGRN